MKKLLALVAIAVFTLQCAGRLLAQSSPTDAPPTARAHKIRVAIFDFDYGTVHRDVFALFGSDIDVGKGISDMLVTYLVKDGTYSVIERKALDKILAEQNFSNSNRADAATTARIGKILGVDAIIIGTVTQFGGENKNTKIGGAGGRFGGFGVGGFGHKSSKATVGIDARLVDTTTGEILAVATGKGESKRESTSLLGGGGSWHGFGAGGVNFGSSDFQSTIIGEATKAAVEQMSLEVIAGNGKLQAHTVVVQGLVAAVDGGQVILNVGGKAGIKVGDQFSVERVTREIKDPSTGQVIRRLATPLGVVQATDVDDLSAACRIVSGTDFKAGDAVKTLAQ